MFAVLPERPDLLENAGYQLVGFSVVMLALGALWGFLEISGAFFRRLEAGRTPPVETGEIAVPAAAATATNAPAVDLPPLTCALIVATVHAASEGRMRVLSATPIEPAMTHAIIAAAVHCAFGERARVVSVRPSHNDPSWAREGRRDIFSSHRIR